ncbi:MAG TPA: AraC family transcriptional regulator [Puia sp.]|nr:AraC family transcriptional regulator [Puia sp.]
MPIPVIPQPKRGAVRDASTTGMIHSHGYLPGRGLESAGCYHTPLFQDQQYPDLRIGLGNYFVQHDPGRDPREQQEPAIWLQIVLKGKLYFQLEGVATGAGTGRSMEEGQYNMFCIPGAHKIGWFDMRNSHVQTLNIYFSPRTLQQAATGFPALAELLRNHEKGLVSMLSCCPGQVGPLMLRMISEIVNCGYEGELRTIYMQTKVTELLLQSMERISQRPAEKDSRIHLKKSDIESIKESRDWLMRHMENPPTLKQLAHHAGINDFKLKKGYKQVFGTTVFSDFHRERMARARKFLLETEMALMEVAMLSGYQDASNFSRAFKSYFGFTAGELRKHA